MNPKEMYAVRFLFGAHNMVIGFIIILLGVYLPIDQVTWQDYSIGSWPLLVGGIYLFLRGARKAHCVKREAKEAGISMKELNRACRILN